MTEARKVAVFGGTGFLGRRVVRHLIDHGFSVRAASRHPERGRRQDGDRPTALEFVRADVNDAASVAATTAGVFAVVNAVSLYVERGEQTFHSVHVRAAAGVARQARTSGVIRLVHVSGIGSDALSASTYIRSRGEGEAAVREAFPGATLIRPAVMFAPDDAFLTPLIRLLKSSPVFPMFGYGRTEVQPAYAEDVAEAIARCLSAPDPAGVYEFGGPVIYSYEALLRTLIRHVGRKTLLVPLPFAAWRMLASAAELLPRPPITRNQVELMEVDNVASGRHPGFDALGIDPRGIETVLGRMGPQA